jgi:pimeloyl-ACP methyl ester carboxylesterase
MATSKLVQRSAKIRGLETAWLEGGNLQGPTLLFLHGFPDTPESWSSQFSHFLDRYHVIAPYSRGTFPSEKSHEIRRYGNASVALDILQLVREAAPNRKIILVGHDLGAAQAWYIAPMLGDQFAGMIIINGMSVQQMAQRLGRIEQQLKSWYIYLFQLPRLPEILLQRFPGRMIRFAHRKAHLRPDLRPRISNTVRGLVHPVNQYRAHVRSLPFELNDRMPIIQKPVLIIWGESDPFLIIPSKNEIAAYARNAQIRILPGSHWIHREKPDQVNQLIEEFVESLELRHEPGRTLSIAGQ